MTNQDDNLLERIAKVKAELDGKAPRNMEIDSCNSAAYMWHDVATLCLSQAAQIQELGNKDALIKDLEGALELILNKAAEYRGCRCSTDDCGPGDCWPCRMMSICELAEQALQKLGE